MTLSFKSRAQSESDRGRSWITLRVFLSLLILVLSLATVGGTGWIAYASSRHSLAELKEREFTLSNETIATEIGKLLDEPAHRILTELTQSAKGGMLPLQLQDGLVLGKQLAERLRVEPTLAWLSYSEAESGNFVGVWRNRNDDIILNRSSPTVNGGGAREEILAVDGQTAPFHRALLQNYDPRKFDWFQLALRTELPVWSKPYHFVEGEAGITASRSWRENNSSRPVGVFTVDFFLKDLELLIDKLSSRQQAYICVLQRDGKLLCAPKENLHNRFSGLLGKLIDPACRSEKPAARSPNDLITVDQDGEKFLVALHHLETPTGFKCVVASLAPAASVYFPAHHIAVIIAETGLAVLFVALLVGWAVAQRISTPLRILSRDLEKVGELQLSSAPLKASFLQEMEILIRASECMKSGLRSFIRYVPDDMVRQLLRSGKDAALGVQPRYLTILFSDIENFTRYSQQVPPDMLVLDLSGYFDILTGAIRQHSGTIDKFIGDGALAFFNAPLDVENHEQMACEAALDAIRKLQTEGMAGPEEEAKRPFRTRIGLHAGEVLVGNIGTLERFAYTVLGDVVNAASRIETLNKVYGTSILASEAVRARTENLEWRYVDRVVVAGRKDPLKVYELLGLKDGTIQEDILLARDLYEQGFGFYFAHDFIRARDLFARAGGMRAGDLAAAVMLQRCEDFARNDPGSNWDGIFFQKEK